MKIDESMKKSIMLVFVIVGLFLSAGATWLISPIVLGAIDNAVDSGSVAVSTNFALAKNNTSNFLAGVFGIRLVNAMGTALSLLTIAVIVLVFAFAFSQYKKRKGGGDGDGDSGMF